MVDFTLSLEVQAKPLMKGLLGFGAPLPREWFKHHASISHLPYFAFPSKEKFAQVKGFLDRQLQQQPSCGELVQPETMEEIRQGIYFTLQFSQLDKALSKEHSFRLAIYQPHQQQEQQQQSEIREREEEEGGIEPLDQIRLHLLSRLPKPATVENLRTKRKEIMKDFLEESWGGGMEGGPSTPSSLLEVKKEKMGGGGRGKKGWMDVDRPEVREREREMRKAERGLKKHYRQMKEQFPDQFLECERAVKGLCEEMKKKGKGGKGNPEVVRHAVLVMMLNSQY